MLLLVQISREKPISHESWSNECDVGFSSEIYYGIHWLGHEFFLNRMSLKRKHFLHFSLLPAISCVFWEQAAFLAFLRGQISNKNLEDIYQV